MGSGNVLTVLGFFIVFSFNLEPLAYVTLMYHLIEQAALASQRLDLTRTDIIERRTFLTNTLFHKVSRNALISF